MAFVLAWVAAFILYTFTLCPTITTGDAAELLLAGTSLDVTHPPGYPVLAMLVRLATCVPAGSLMHRAGLVNAAAGAFAVALLWSTARALGASRAASALASALFAVSPLAWSQATMLEKYAVQLALAALVLRLCLPDSRDAGIRAVFAWAIALTHHSIAVFLLPVLALPLWRERRRWSRRAAATAVMLAALPLTGRPLYTAIRSSALHLQEPAGVRSINWCEPYRAGALIDYLRVRYYAARFSPDVGLERAGWRDHLGYFPAELTWPGLAAALAGLAVLLARRGGAGWALLGALATSALFNSRFVLPPSLADVYHQDAFMILALCAAVGADQGLRLMHGRRGLRGTAVLAAAAALAAWTIGRAPARDASRHFCVYDYNRGQLALAPRNAVFIGCFDYDMFALRYFQEDLGFRGDLVPLQAPVRLGPGQFVVRRHYRSWAAALLPGTALRFTDDDSGFTILRRLIGANPGLCFVVSGLSDPMAPEDIFRSWGNLFVARTASCGGAGNPLRAAAALRAVSGRCWLSPGAGLRISRTMVEYWAQALARASFALQGTDSPVREKLLRERTRLIPEQSAAWAALAALEADAGRSRAAAEHWERALDLDPASVELRLDLLRFQLRTGATASAAAMVRDAMTREPFNRSPSAPRAVEQLDAGRTPAALEAAYRAFAETALSQGEKLPGNPEFEGARVRLFRIAATLAPDWPEAQRRIILVLQGRARYDEAWPFVNRLMALEPGDTSFAVAQASGWLELGRFGEARDLLVRLTRDHGDLAAAWFYLGQAGMATGDRTGATAAFNRFLSLSPASPMAPMVRDILARLR